MANSIRQSLLEALPRSLALQLYLLRNKAILASGKVYNDIKLDLFVPTRNLLWIQRLESGEGHEKGICELMSSQFDNNSNFIYCDVGTCFGFFPALLSELKPNIQIFAFEAGWQQFYFLEKNKKLYSNKNNWTIENKFVGSRTKHAFVKLDDYFRNLDLVPTVIQIDVDGFENEVLIGCKEIIENKKTQFLLELHPLLLNQFNTSTEEVLEHFKGYSMKVLTDLRSGNAQWSNDLNQLYSDDNPYLLISPN